MASQERFMSGSDHLLEIGEPIWQAQKNHPFVVELADGSLDRAAFEHWLKQDYRYLQDYARLWALAGTTAREEERMTALLDIAHTVLDTEMDLHRSFAADYGISQDELEATEKAPTCVAYTNFLLRTAYEGSIAEIAAALYPCMQGYLDIADHMAELADDTHEYTPFIETYTGEEFREDVAWGQAFVDDCWERYPGEREAMEDAFLMSAKLEYRFWEMAYTEEGWGL